jgi:GT2 family glycosyltransferase
VELINTVIDLAEVGFVVPTLGTRHDYLVQCIQSIKNAGCQNIFIVGPISKLNQILEPENLKVNLIQDPGAGLTEAINLGVRNLPSEVKYFGWLGDDDLLSKSSILNSLERFERIKNAVATYGSCKYIYSDGSEIFLNKSGSWASTYMKFLPNLIPQPGSLIKRLTFELIDGLKPTYPLSFDFEMFFNLKNHGQLIFINDVQSYFRWHPESLSVDQRKLAVSQTSEIRRNNQSKILRKFSILWEPIIIQATIFIGSKINKRTM